MIYIIYVLYFISHYVLNILLYTTNTPTTYITHNIDSPKSAYIHNNTCLYTNALATSDICIYTYIYAYICI